MSRLILRKQNVTEGRTHGRTTCKHYTLSKQSLRGIIKGIEEKAFIKQGWAISKDTNSAASFCFLTHWICTLCFFDGYTFITERFKRYAKIITHLKIQKYPTHFDYYSLAIKFNILSLSKFCLFSVCFVCRGRDIF